MLRCPKCGQTSWAWMEGKFTRNFPPVRFKKKAVLYADVGEPVDLDSMIKEKVRLFCPFCRHEDPAGEWREARLKPASLWDEEEDIGVVTDPFAFTEENVEEIEDLDLVTDLKEDPWGGDDDGSDD